MPTDNPPDSLLLVDDTPANLTLLSQILRHKGYQLRAVTSGGRALASVDLNPPDLVLLDIRMPEMDGYEVCRRLKANPKTTEIPVIFISALDDIEDKVRAFGVGGVDYVTKPFQVDEVIARVETHLALRHLQQRLQESNRRLESELHLAAQVQASFLPQRLPTLPGWQLAVALLPAQLTSGDFFDVISLPDGTVGLIIADVVDKGVGAALFMAMSCALLRAYLLEQPSHPEAVCQAVNQRILDYTSANQFVTLFLAVLEPATGRLVYCNAGHPAPVWLGRAAGEPCRSLPITGLPLGVLEDADWQRETIVLRPGDALVLYTDGVTEAANAAGEFFGSARLTRTVCEAARASAEGLKATVLAAVQGYTAGAPLPDDIALLVLARDA